MHYNFVKLPKKRLLALTILLSGVIIGLIVWSALKQSHDAQLVSGTLQASEVEFGSRQSGRVSEVLVEEGQTLKEGQLILVLENRELISQRNSIKSQVKAEESLLVELKNGATKEELAKAEANYKRSRASYEMSKSGNRKEDIEASKAAMEMAQSEKYRARQDLDRKQKLFEEQLITADQLEEIQKKYKVADKKYEEANQKYKKVLSGNRKEEVQESFYRMKAEEANYRDLQKGTRIEKIQSQEARVEALKSQLAELQSKVDELEVRASCDCELNEFEIEPGDLILPNQVLGVLVDLQNVWVEAYLPEETYGKVWPGNKVKITSLTYPNEKFIGKVKYVGLKSEFTPRNIQTIEGRKQQVYKVKVLIDNSNKLFRPGMDLEMMFDFHERK